MRGADRRGRARVGSGRELRVGARPRRVAAAVGGELDARARGGRAVVRDRRARVRRASRRPRGGGTATRSSTGRFPTRSAIGSCGGSPSRSTSRALRLAADPFVGEHDFASFCRKGPEGSSLTRRVLESHWVDEGDGVLRYEICANAFCWQMVRAIVGTLVEVGRGQAPAGRDAGGAARRRPQRGGAAGPAARLVSLGGRLLTPSSPGRSAIVTPGGS